MLRSLLIMLSKVKWIQQLIMEWNFAWKAASRFIAGERVEAAMKVARNLNLQGIQATVDHLGENTFRPEDAAKATSEILQTLEKIHQENVQANLSVKLTQIGLVINTELCKENLVRILNKAQEYNNFIRIDMEDSFLIDRTIDLYQQMRSAGFNNLGLVIQAYLYRSQADLEKLAGNFTRIRLCKGAYKEPPERAYPKKKDVDANFDRLVGFLFDEARKIDPNNFQSDPFFPPIPAIATHDARRVAYAKEYGERIGLPKQDFEFQMLLGIRRDLQEDLVKQGYRVRVYVPYGTHWYPYFMRRLAERPENIWFFISNYFKK
jgi:proline dehydrogenase